MKRYYNKTTNSWYTEGNSITIKNNNSLFSGIPTEEQLTEWGYEEYVEPVYEESVEETEIEVE